MGNSASSSTDIAEDEMRVRGLYEECKWDARKVRTLIRSGRLGPCHVGIADASEADGLEECPICLYNYPTLNRAKCCGQAICTECLLQLHTPKKRAVCPFCKANPLLTEYTGALSDEAREQRVLEEEKVRQLKKQMREDEVRRDAERLRSRTASSESWPPTNEEETEGQGDSDGVGGETAASTTTPREASRDEAAGTGSESALAPSNSRGDSSSSGNRDVSDVGGIEGTESSDRAERVGTDGNTVVGSPPAGGRDAAPLPHAQSRRVRSRSTPGSRLAAQRPFPSERDVGRLATLASMPSRLRAGRRRRSRTDIALPPALQSLGETEDWIVSGDWLWEGGGASGVGPSGTGQHRRSRVVPDVGMADAQNSSTNDDDIFNNFLQRTLGSPLPWGGEHGQRGRSMSQPVMGSSGNYGDDDSSSDEGGWSGGGFDAGGRLTRVSPANDPTDPSDGSEGEGARPGEGMLATGERERRSGEASMRELLGSTLQSLERSVDQLLTGEGGMPPGGGRADTADVVDHGRQQSLARSHALQEAAQLEDLMLAMALRNSMLDVDIRGGSASPGGGDAAWGGEGERGGELDGRDESLPLPTPLDTDTEIDGHAPAGEVGMRPVNIGGEGDCEAEDETEGGSGEISDEALGYEAGGEGRVQSGDDDDGEVAEALGCEGGGEGRIQSGGDDEGDVADGDRSFISPDRMPDADSENTSDPIVVNSPPFQLANDGQDEPDAPADSRVEGVDSEGPNRQTFMETTIASGAVGSASDEAGGQGAGEGGRHDTNSFASAAVEETEAEIMRRVLALSLLDAEQASRRAATAAAVEPAAVPTMPPS